MFEKVDHFSNITWTNFHLTNTIRRVYREGIRKPFEVIKKGNKYILMSNPITFNAAKSLNYSAVPCLIRKPLHELILNKMLKTLDVE